MREKSHKKIAGANILTSRISILFFFTILAEGLLWGITALYHNYGLIFYRVLPFALPIFAALGLAAFLFLALRISYKGDPRKEKVFSLSYLLYLLLALIAITLIPWIFDFLPGLGTIKWGAQCVCIGLIGYFIAYLLYTKIRPHAAVLAWQSTFYSILLSFFYERSLDGGRYFLSGGAYHYLPVYADGLILSALALLGLALCFFLGKLYKKLKVRPWALILPAALAIAAFLVTALADTALAAATQRWIVYGSIGLQALWVMGTSLAIQMKKL